MLGEMGAIGAGTVCLVGQQMALLGGQMQFGGPATPRPAERVIGRFGFANTVRWLFLSFAVAAGASGGLMRSVDRGIHTYLPRDESGGVGPGLQGRQDH
ncbi:hypothetical protein [Actinophytocola sp. KF-1]